MTKTTQRDHALFISAFILALALRLIKLDSLPLGDLEASWALQAFHLSQNAHPVLGSQSGYILPTALLFFIFGSTDFMARVMPALAGSLLVLIPYILRDRLPGKSAILLAFFLALEPGLLALSRTVGSPIIAVSFTLLALSFWLTRHPRWAGFFGALALLSGPALWPGLLSLVTAWLASGGISRLRNREANAETTEGLTASRREIWKPALITGGGNMEAGADHRWSDPARVRHVVFPGSGRVGSGIQLTGRLSTRLDAILRCPADAFTDGPGSI
jgi:hypothetical protein